MPAASQLNEQERSLPLQRRSSQVEPATFDKSARTVEAVWTSGARVRRFDPWTGSFYEEELDLSPGAVDMSRFEADAVPVLDAHNQYNGISSIIGVVVRAWLANGEGRALLQLSQRPELAGLVGDIAAGVIRNISVGYSVQKYEVTRAADRTDGGAVDLWRAIRWQPAELSFVPIGADLAAGTRSAAQQQQRSEELHACAFAYPSISNHAQETRMPAKPHNTAQTTEEAVLSVPDEIRAMVRRHRLPDAFSADLISRGVTVERAGLEILERMAHADVAIGGHINVTPIAQGTGYAPAYGRTSQQDARLAMMAEAIAARASGGSGMTRDNPYRRVSTVDMARELLESRGVRTGALSHNEIIERALHTTSDFPTLLQTGGQRVLRAAYESYPGGIKRVARKSTSRDFRAVQRVQLSEAPQLVRVNEHGEFKHGGMSEGKEAYSLGTYGVIFGITRQALVNDDLGAFGTTTTRFGTATAEFESKFLSDLVISNPVLTTDSLNVFHATHGNLATGAGSALQESSLSTARTAMRLQKGLDGKTPISAGPTYLIVPAALETTAEKLLFQINATKSSDVNPFAGKLELVVEPRLDAASQTAWYLAADYNLIDTIEYSYLDGEEGPQILIREGFEIDGLEMKVRMDFGAGILDFRGLYKSNGV